MTPKRNFFESLGTPKTLQRIQEKHVHFGKLCWGISQDGIQVFVSLEKTRIEQTGDPPNLFQKE